MFGWQGALIGTLLLAAGSWALAREGRVDAAEARGYARAVFLGASAIFLAVHAFEWSAALGAGITPRSSVFAGLYFVLTGVHALHVLAGAAAALFTRVNRRLLLYYWWLVDLVWVGIVMAFHL